MRSLLLLTLLIALAGCAEAVNGPRIVPYTEDRFYIRHVPVLDSRGDVDLLAGRVCEQVGKEAIFEEAEKKMKGSDDVELTEGSGKKDTE